MAQHRSFRNLVLLAILTLASCAGATDRQHSSVLVFGASGRLGGAVVEEALLRGYRVTGVTRDASRLDHLADRIDVEEGDILDRDRTAELLAGHDAVIVSVGGKPQSQDPSEYIAALAATSLVEVLSTLGDSGPRLIFVGNLFTLKFEEGKSLLELGRVDESHRNYAMFHGHQLALDTFRNSTGIRWTVASPPNGLGLKGRTGDVVWGNDHVIRDADGKPASISLEDYAYAIFEELVHGDYERMRFTVARREPQDG